MLPLLLLILQHFLHIRRHDPIIDGFLFLPLINDVLLCNLLNLLLGVALNLLNDHQFRLVVYFLVVLELDDVRIVLEDYGLEEYQLRFLHFLGGDQSEQWEFPVLLFFLLLVAP